ncbi:site-specific DNA-methyltransferase [Halomonas sp. DQ26W]|uniref:DNA methyltransferase n=1 Tax=Halomonas sp. DQ26W TaxID=2282311 RepID=UPI000DF83EA5|nr:DNA methyltransferase [Halomonas sp. DQ26W]RDB43429.1 site-specific DNA-methyltransferase [Halomonas sp. DQ26W]
MNVATVDGHKERFIKLLHELFQLDKPELDFGLYRIMHAKSDQLSRFIREDLAQAIEEAFAEQGEQQLAAMRQEIEEKRRQAEELGAPDPDRAPAVKQARAAYDVAKREHNASADIYDHLYRFFSRYYDKGDFMSRRHHVAENDSRAAPYAVPYDGREVYLHWANKDQYYVKSSETLSNFTFELGKAIQKEMKRRGLQPSLDLGVVQDAYKVHLRVVDATEGEHNDVKESTERYFIIHRDEPVRPDGADLVLQFEYRPDPEKTGQSSTWQKKLLEDAEDVIMASLRTTDGVAAFRDGLATKAPTDKQRERTLLGKYLQQYTARNTMDYFIHKDLGGFLSRELDFYIKNEILRLDDIDNAGVLIVEQQLKKVQVLRKIAKQIITFLAQLENFQKKLWLKRKFVKEADYCLTLDKLEGREEILYEIFQQELQRKQWVDFYAINLDELDGDLSSKSVSELVKNEKYRFLMVDTALLPKSLKYEISNLSYGEGDCLDGVLVQSDSFHASRLMASSLRSSVDTIYIDPPYNTGKDDFIYKDGYQSSSWLSMVYDRISNSHEFLRESGGFFSSCDENEFKNLSRVVENIFGENNFVSEFVWKTDGNFDNQAKVKLAHEYILFYSKNRDHLPYPSAIEGWASEDSKLFNDNIVNTIVKNGPKNPPGDVILPVGFPSNEQDFFLKNDDITWPKYSVDVEVNDWKLSHEVKARSGWSSKTLLLQFIESGLNPVYDNKGQETVFYLTKNGAIESKKKRSKDHGHITSLIQKVGTTQSTSSLLNHMGVPYPDYPKPIGLMRHIASIVKDSKFILDYFAGSGSTAHGVIEESRGSGKKIKYALIEMGEHFDSVMKPRIHKAVYSSSWRDQAPKKDDNGELGGLSHAFKYFRLESYDDTLNNLKLDDNAQRDALMEQNPELRRDYTLKYLLDVETRGSASLLNTEWFRDPEGYTLNVKQPGSDETRETAVDLVETFNWLIGLHVTHLDKPRTYIARFKREEDPELPEDQNTRLKAEGLRENEDGAYWIRQVEGHVRRIPGSDEDLAKVLVVWRKLTDDPEKDAAVLEALLEKYKIGTTDSEFDAIYINGPHGLNLTGSARSRVHSLEETFHARMWEGCDDE